MARSRHRNAGAGHTGTDPDAVPASLEAVGLNAGSVAAVLVTHAHNDHIDAAEHLRAAYDVPVLMHQGSPHREHRTCPVRPCPCPCTHRDTPRATAPTSRPAAATPWP
ncbi:MBL fold metallo-hydrolase [Streptomyces sp. NPDC059340]|uniref:MBL fold metallo-hydrolase n=1 Tax=Streptomyces sp. NPDC059340 TaxID=3346806 RepID=UPI00368BF215